jgi:hypothetical protein
MSEIICKRTNKIWTTVIPLKALKTDEVGTEFLGPSLPYRAKIVKNRAHKRKKRPKPGKYTSIKEKNRAKTRAKSSKPGDSESPGSEGPLASEGPLHMKKYVVSSKY